MATGFVQRFKGRIKAASLFSDFGSSTKGLFDNSGARLSGVWNNAGAPTGGAGGTLAGIALPGDLLQDTTGLALYQNTGTQAAPIWTAVSAETSAQTTAAYNTNAATAAVTLSAANITGADAEVVLALTGALAAGAAATLPTVAALAAALHAPQAGLSYKLRIINESSGAFAWTVTTNTGWTLNGTMTIAQNTWRDFIVMFTSATTATLQSVGTGANS